MPRLKPRDWPVLGKSNGHEWIKPTWLFHEACRFCGITRRGDDKNKPCKGPVPLDLREAKD